jgi:hypothetical protein
MSYGHTWSQNGSTGGVTFWCEDLTHHMAFPTSPEQLLQVVWQLGAASIALA